jgi:hypothetical protein
LKNKILTILIVAISLATISFLFYGVVNRSDNSSVNNCGGINRQSGSQILSEICANDSNLQNLTGGTYSLAGGICNETGESTAYLITDRKEVYIMTLETANGTVKSFKLDKEEEIIKIAKEFDSNSYSVKREVIGGDIYKVTIDTPNKTVESIETVNKLPDWIIEINNAKEVVTGETIGYKIDFHTHERTGYSREKSIDSVNSFVILQEKN